VVAAVSLLSFSALGTVAYKVASQCSTACPEQRTYATYDRQGPCDPVEERLGDDRASWSEFDWYVYAACFEQHNKSDRVIKIASQGLRHHPRSEALFNLKGYHQIVLGQHGEAIETLRTGMERVRNHHSGTMANNLAWAGLWSRRDMTLDESRKLYKKALSRDSQACELIHTGLWVEFAIAKESQGFERYEALRAFGDLRDDYRSCHSRVNRGDWETLTELVGAAVLFEMVDDGTFDNRKLRNQVDTSREPNALLVETGKKLRSRFKGSSIDALCEDAMPLTSVHRACVEQVDNVVTELRHKEREAMRADTSKKKHHTRRAMTKRELEESLRARPCRHSKN
jgi:tetratricopeptide (TPR) repeat protein